MQTKSILEITESTHTVKHKFGLSKESHEQNEILKPAYMQNCCWILTFLEICTTSDIKNIYYIERVTPILWQITHIMTLNCFIVNIQSLLKLRLIKPKEMRKVPSKLKCIGSKVCSPRIVKACINLTHKVACGPVSLFIRMTWMV